MLQCLIGHLGGPVNFALVTHEMLGDLYERSLVAERHIGSQSLIKLRGVHYTPLSVAREILHRIPVEHIPPGTRTVCDFACGSGSFLLAATDRLAQLFDPREVAGNIDKTQYLRAAVLGNDIDPVAILMTRLSYLIAYWNRSDAAGDVPYPQLREQDALSMDLSSAFGRPPAVIVGNPPFDGPQPASHFLRRAITTLLAAPKGPRFIGMVMPAAFLKGRREQIDVRRELLKHGRILELWELPEQAIGLCAETATCVVIARIGERAQTEDGLARVCQTFSRQTEAIKLFRDAALPTWSFVTPATGGASLTQASSEGLAVTSIDDAWITVEQTAPRLSSLCEVCWGFVHTRAQGLPRPEFGEHATQDFVPFFRRQAALRPYIVTIEDWRSSHSDERRYWKRGSGHRPFIPNWPNFESDKLIVSARGNRNTASQLVAALDRNKIYPAKDFLAITLRNEWESIFSNSYSMEGVDGVDVLRWICAILNSPLGHAWFAKHAGPRGFNATVCENLPLPKTFNPKISEQVKILEEMSRPSNLKEVPTWAPPTRPSGRSLFDMLDDNDSDDFWRRVAKLNEWIELDYDISSNNLVRLHKFLLSTIDPWADHRPDATDLSESTKLRILRGRLISIDWKRQSVEVELSWKRLGGGDPVTLPIPKFMPGWVLDETREFSCRAPSEATIDLLRVNPWILRDFRPQPYTYLNEEELIRLVGFQARTPTT
jgi:hypothetical protein